MSDIKRVTDATFQQDVLQADGLVLVDFWAPWCGPCRAVAPVLEQIAAQYEGRVTIAKVNVDENPQAPANYGVRSIPTIALFKGGEVIDGVLGAAPQPFFAQLLDKHLEPATAEAQ
ncbi:MAG: thioredoxin [Gemmatimonadota bacterium]|nr:thioredoxin [Gemmatimonadota bacterium]MDH5196603.1 thioredoxin [Gemmatimonadota bacterium]